MPHKKKRTAFDGSGAFSFGNRAIVLPLTKDVLFINRFSFTKTSGSAGESEKALASRNRAKRVMQKMDFSVRLETCAGIKPPT